MCGLLHTLSSYQLPHGPHVCYCTCVIPVDYRTDDTRVTVLLPHATPDWYTRALPTRGHARPCIHRAGRHIHNFRARRSLYYKHVAAQQATEEDNPEGKQYALNSGAHPSHVRKLTPQMKPLRKIIRSTTAINITPSATHKGMIHIQTSTNRHFQIPTMANQAMQLNLLSVHDIAEQ